MHLTTSRWDGWTDTPQVQNSPMQLLGNPALFAWQYFKAAQASPFDSQDTHHAKSTIPYFSYRTRRSQANQTFQLSVTLCIPNGRSRETPACRPVCVLASRRVVATVIGWLTKHWKLSSIWKWVIGVLKTRLITLTMTSRPS